MTTPPDSDRIVELETAVTHLQHDFERLHSVALELQVELRQLTLRLARTEQQLERLAEPPDIRSPAEERPPHY